MGKKKRLMTNGLEGDQPVVPQYQEFIEGRHHGHVGQYKHEPSDRVMQLLLKLH